MQTTCIIIIKDFKLSIIIIYFILFEGGGGHPVHHIYRGTQTEPINIVTLD